jgi:hypothetical protein
MAVNELQNSNFDTASRYTIQQLDTGRALLLAVKAKGGKSYKNGGQNESVQDGLPGHAAEAAKTPKVKTEQAARLLT